MELQESDYFINFTRGALRHYFTAIRDIVDPGLGEGEEEHIDLENIKSLMEAVQLRSGDKYCEVISNEGPYLIVRSKDSGITVDHIINKETLQHEIIEVG